MMIPGCGQGKRYHGTQVGIGILACATLYQRLADLEPHDINPDAVADQIPTWESLEARLREQFGTVADAVLEQARRKYRTPEQAKAKAADIAERWPHIWNRLRGILRSADQVRDLLETAGAPTTITALGLELCDLRRALGLCRHIRDRYTVLDFAADIGRWTEADQLAVLEQSGTLK